MADEADRAAERMELEERLRERARAQQKVNGHGPAYCMTCGDDMPVARRKHGFRDCVTCAEMAERYARLRRQ